MRRQHVGLILNIPFFRLMVHLIEMKNYTMAKKVGDETIEDAWESMFQAYLSGDDNVDHHQTVALGTGRGSTPRG